MQVGHRVTPPIYDACIDPHLPLYGLDIETDTTIDGLDPAVAPIVSVAVAGVDVEAVFDGDEAAMLTDLDEMLRDLEPGILVTWNGSGFDMPFLGDRAHAAGVELGLELWRDNRLRSNRPPLRGHFGLYRASWYRHLHLDAYRVYRNDVGRSLGISCGLKPLAHFVSLPVVEVDASQIHLLSRAEVHDYVLSDAVLARQLTERRWPTISGAVDQVISK